MKRNVARTPHATAAAPEHLIQVLEGRWKFPILLRLSQAGGMRFSDLARSIPNISKRMLTQQLKQMQTDGLVSRLFSEGPPARVEYRLTDWGRALRPSLASLVEWSQMAPNRGTPPAMARQPVSHNPGNE